MEFKTQAEITDLKHLRKGRKAEEVCDSVIFGKQDIEGVSV